MSSLPSTKVESLLDLDKGIVEKTVFDSLEAVIASAKEFQDPVLSWKASARQLCQKGKCAKKCANSSTARSPVTQNVTLPRLLTEKNDSEISQRQGFWS